MQRLNLRNLSAAFVLLFAAASWAGYGTAALTPLSPADVAAAIRDYVGETQAPSGLLRINDPVENATLDLKLTDVYAEKLMKVRPDTYVTCAYFSAPDGTAYDVDFYVKGTTRRNLKVVDATIHAKNKLQRYAWADEKGFMRVKAISSEMPMQEELAH